MKVLIGRLTTFNRGKPLANPKIQYRQIYIHSKLMIIDDSFFTIGSANMSQRSMAVDSEINIATDDHGEAQALRQKIWKQHAGNNDGSERTSGESIGGDGGQNDVAKAFKSWMRLMDKNAKSVKKGHDILGYLVPFNDDRKIDYRHG